MADNSSLSVKHVAQLSEYNRFCHFKFNGRQRPGPIPYKVYALLLKYLLNREIPTEKFLKEAGITLSSLELDWDLSLLQSQTDECRTIDQGTSDADVSSILNDSQQEQPMPEASAIAKPAICEANNTSRSSSTEPGPTRNISEHLKVIVKTNDKNVKECILQGTSKDVLAPTSRSGREVEGSESISNWSYPSDLLKLLAEEDASSRSRTTNIDDDGKTMMMAINNSRRIKFLSWAQRMYINVDSATDGKEFQVVSLMSKKTNKEIAPKESFEQIIAIMHSKSGKPGQEHFSASATIAEIKKHYTFGRRDFGMSEELVRKIVAKCDTPNCIALDLRNKASSKHVSLSMEPNFTNIDTTTPLSDPFVVDKFYQGKRA